MLADVPTLTSILTYHVLPRAAERRRPRGRGTFTTVNGADLNVAMVNDTLVINGGAAAVQCADVPTANATVFLIDTVLMPPMRRRPRRPRPPADPPSKISTREIVPSGTKLRVEIFGSPGPKSDLAGRVWVA